MSAPSRAEMRGAFRPGQIARALGEHLRVLGYAEDGREHERDVEAGRCRGGAMSCLWQPSERVPYTERPAPDHAVVEVVAGRHDLASITGYVLGVETEVNGQAFAVDVAYVHGATEAARAEATRRLASLRGQVHDHNRGRGREAQQAAVAALRMWPVLDGCCRAWAWHVEEAADGLEATCLGVFMPEQWEDAARAARERLLEVAAEWASWEEARQDVDRIRGLAEIEAEGLRDELEEVSAGRRAPYEHTANMNGYRVWVSAGAPWCGGCETPEERRRREAGG